MFRDLLKEIKLPEFVRVDYRPPMPPCVDVATEVERGLLPALQEIDLQGKTVALTAGSRDIYDMPALLWAVVRLLREWGAEPFLVPAMGSHGGATAEGQEMVLSGLGITEEACGAPIRSSMETVLLGETANGIPVYTDQIASRADLIIPIGRVKPHTEFHGEIESGVLKMLAVGLGKQRGASEIHARGTADLPRNIELVSAVALKKLPIPFGIAILENSLHRTHAVHVIPAAKLIEEEKKLLKQARNLLPSFPISPVDVLSVYEMGKDISGTGMDSNVTGRSLYLAPARPFPRVLTVHRLTEKSMGNANGVGTADVITQKLADAFDPIETYPNAITSADPRGTRLPVTMPTDRQALQLAIRFSGEDAPGMALVRNTLDLSRIYVCRNILERGALPEHCHVREEGAELFDPGGHFRENLWN